MKKIYPIALMVGILLTVVCIASVNASPATFEKTFYSDTASTIASPTYTLAGKATSTVSVYSPIKSSNKYNEAIVSFQVTSTTTPPSVLFRIETSYDNSNWFAYSTSTGSTSYITPAQYSFTFASTTYTTYSDPSGDSTKNNGSFTVSIPAPYYRIKAFSPVGNPAYNFYIEVKPAREQ